jgi:capsular polysaccharide transport system ATP-binding protein
MSIVFSGVHKALRQKTRKTSTLEGVDVKFEGDKITGVLAAPGAGKSTLIALASGKLRPDRGRVSRSSNVSFPVAGGGVFNGLLTARENVAFLCRVAGFDPRPIIKFIIDFTELNAAMDRQFKSLNRDERTKILFTSVYAIPYDLYLVDEVIIGGRGAFRDQCKTLVEGRMQTAGFLIATSSAAVLKTYCESFAVLNQGTVTMVDSQDAAEQAVGRDRLKNGDGSSEHASDEMEMFIPRNRG